MAQQFERQPKQEQSEKMPPIPVTKSRHEINLQRLLERCEEVVLERRFSWRLAAYVEALEKFFKALEKQNTQQPSFERLNELRKRIDFVKGAIQTAAAKPEMKLVEQTKVTRHPERAVHRRQQTKVDRELRENLFSEEEKKKQPPPHDVDRILREQDAMQQRIAESMISFAQELKRNAQTAKHIIAKDTEVAKRNLRSTEDNFGRLQTESVRLEEQLSSPCSCHCMMWIMLLIVLMVFPCMVIFIRFFPKRS